jgi:uncharacterized protein (TIGR00725 family)
VRVPIIGVMGDGNRDYPDLTVPLGQTLARVGFHLLTGAGGGVMLGVSQAFGECVPRAGIVIGVIPSSGVRPGLEYQAKTGYPNAFVEVPIFTHLPGGGTGTDDPLTRNHINVLSSDFIVLLPGGPGTALEAALARAYGKPMYELNRADQLPELTAVLQKQFPPQERG